MYYTSITTWFLFGLAASAQALLKAGDFQNYAHGISGEVYIKDEQHLVIKGFSYDGAGPDAFFWVGKEGAPSTVGTILPYPFNGVFYDDYEDQSAPILTGRFQDQEIELTLPPNLKTTDLKWLSVWCRRFAVNFGDMFFPEGLTLDEEATAEDHHEHDDENDIEDESIPEDLPPPLIEPVNSHDPSHRDHDWKDDSDVYSAAESEGEPEGEGGSANIHHLSWATLLMVVSVYLL